MKVSVRKRSHHSLIVPLFAFVALSAVSVAHAANRIQHPRLHWTLDARFHHNHYYPARGYVISVLPVGSIRIAFRGGHLFFNAGVWYRPDGKRFVVAAPPFGIRIPILPPGYATVWVGSLPYYYANNTYYMADPSGDYVVVAPPPETDVVTVAPPPPAPPAVTPGILPIPAGDGLIVYPKNGQSAAQMTADRAKCTSWAIGQTGYDPARSSPSDARRSDFQRAASACLEAHGYTVR